MSTSRHPLRVEYPVGLPDGLHWGSRVFRRGSQLWEVSLSAGRVRVIKLAKHRGFDDVWHVDFAVDTFFKGDLEFTQIMASKYIKAAVAKQEGLSQLMSGHDPVLFNNRPALLEFMSSLADDDGKVRDLSILMIQLHQDGVRVGLKDEAAGGWVWRNEETLAKALNAIEKALQAGNVQWSIPGGRYPRKK